MCLRNNLFRRTVIQFSVQTCLVFGSLYVSGIFLRGYCLSRYIKTFDNAMPESLCNRLIKKFNEDKRVKPDPQPSYSTREFIFASDKKDWLPILYEVTEIGNRLTMDYFQGLGGMIHDWFDDGYVIARYRKGDTCVLHNDDQSVQVPCNSLRYATLLFYLNTVEGGETFFPQQEIKVSPKQGRAVMFPAMLTHPHEVLSPESDRYIIQTWITDPEMVVNLRDDDEKF